MPNKGESFYCRRKYKQTDCGGKFCSSGQQKQTVASGNSERWTKLKGKKSTASVSNYINVYINGCFSVFITHTSKSSNETRYSTAIICNKKKKATSPRVG